MPSNSENSNLYSLVNMGETPPQYKLNEGPIPPEFKVSSINDVTSSTTVESALNPSSTQFVPVEGLNGAEGLLIKPNADLVKLDIINRLINSGRTPEEAEKIVEGLTICLDSEEYLNLCTQRADKKTGLVGVAIGAAEKLNNLLKDNTLAAISKGLPRFCILTVKKL